MTAPLVLDRILDEQTSRRMLKDWKARPREPYWFFDGEPFPLNKPDFCRSLVEPERSRRLPDGTVGMRCGDGFWLVAELPWAFRHLSARNIVAVLWPGLVAKATFGPDNNRMPRIDRDRSEP